MDPLTIGILVGLGLNTVGNVGNGIANYKNSAKADRALYAVDSIRSQIKENNANVEKDIMAVKDNIDSARVDIDGAWNNINYLKSVQSQHQIVQQPPQITQQPVQVQPAVDPNAAVISAIEKMTASFDKINDKLDKLSK